MVHRSPDSRLLVNLLQQEKDYSKQLGQVIDASNASLASFAAYAAASAPPASHVIMDVAGALAAADEALRKYAQGVDEWREVMRNLKDAEEEVGNIMRDREILVTRLIKASKPSKSGSGSIRESLLLSNQRFPSSSSLALSFGGSDSPSPTPSRPLSSSFSSSTKLAAAQAELQACETHLATKERELLLKRNAALRNGLGARMRALVECGRAWSELGKNALRSLDELHEQRQASSMQELLRLPELDSQRPSSDFSSIGPSQSASQVNGHHELPPPVSIATVMNSALLGDALLGSTNEQTITNERRPQSHQSSNSSIFSSPAIPTTYQVETVTYAPAIAVRVAGKDAPASQQETQDGFPLIPMPAPHALEGYVYDIPTATNSMAGPSGLHSHSRSNSGRSTPQGHTSRSNVHQLHVLERRITEDSQEDRRRNSAALTDDVDSFEEVKQEEKLVAEGKLAVVENPRFVSEARRREIEREKEKARKEEENRAKKEKGKQRETDDDPTQPREKKRFSLFHHVKHDRDQPHEDPTTPVTSDPNERGSPSKGRFLGGLRGLFSTKSLAVSPQTSPTAAAHTARAEGDDSDSDTEISPSKTPNKGLHNIFRPADKEKSKPSSRWETRTDKNLREVARRGESFDGHLVKPPPNKYGGGLAGATVAQVGMVTAAGVGQRRRVASEAGTSQARGDAASTAPAPAGKKLKKARGGGAAADETSNVGATNTPTQREFAAVGQTHKAKTKKGGRRSASVDPSENRRSWAEQTDEGEGDGMIIDLGRRRRTASEVGGTRSDVGTSTAVKIGAPAHNTTTGAGKSQSAFAERTTDVFGLTKPIKGYSSDTAAIQLSAAGGLTKKKSLTKKRGQETTPAPKTTSTAAAATPAQPAAQPLFLTAHAQQTVTPPTRKASVKVTPATAARAGTPTSHHPHQSSTTVLAAGGGQPSGVLVPQAGWGAQAQGGGLARNNSTVSAASAPASGGPARGKKKATTLGQGMGGSGGVARRASLGSGASPAKAEVGAGGATTQAFQPLPPAATLMSIVEDVARTNREGWAQDLKMRKSVGGSTKATGMLDLVKAPPLMERSKLEAMEPVHVKGRAAGAVAAEAASPGSRTGMFEIKAPGSVFDQRKAEGGNPRDKPPPPAQGPPKTTSSTLSTTPTPLRSALRNSSRSPSPMAGPSHTSRTPNEAAGQEHHALSPPVAGGVPWGNDGTLQQHRKPEQSRAKAPAAPEETDPSGDESEVFYSDLEEVEVNSSSTSRPNGVPSAQQSTQANATKPLPPPVSGLNGYANGHVGRAASEVSTSSTSTFVQGSSSVLRTGQDGTNANGPRRRKSVRVSLQPTFSPSPPAIDYEDDQEARAYAPWAAPAPVLPAPIPLRTEAKPAVVEHVDMWADSDDEDEQYSRAKRLLTRAAKKEKDVSRMVSNRVY